MSITVNGQSCVPPGFRFHPTEEELLNYYLRKKLVGQNIDLDFIRDVDLNKLEPWDIQDKCKIGSTPQNDWYFFSHKDKKYPTGTRTNRATAAGFWKATGRDKVIYTGRKRIGMRKTLVFYKGRAPHGQKSDWIMHEYRLDESNSLSHVQVANTMGEANNQEDGWVVCRVFKKKNLLHKSSDSPNNSTPSITVDAKTHFLLHSQSDGALDQILQYMGRSCKQERFMKLPALESPTIPPMAEEFSNKYSYPSEDIRSVVSTDAGSHVETGMTDWTALDRLVASHLNGQSDASKQLYSCFDDPTSFTLYNNNGGTGGGSSNDDGDLWSLASSASDPISHVSHTSI